MTTHTSPPAPPSVPPFPLVQLAAAHRVHEFTCGTRAGAREIDEYLRTSALREQAAGLSTVWVATDPAATSPVSDVAGYFSLSPLSIQISPAVLEAMGLPAVPYRTIGGYLLGRLGVARRLQGRRLGATLVAAAIKTARRAQGDVGGAFVAVDPKDDGLVAWYVGLGFGFRRLDSGRRRIVLPLFG